MRAWYLISAAIIVADQVTKYLALEGLAVPIELLPILTLRLACNTGAAFSMLEGSGWLFMCVGVVFSSYFIYEIWRLPKKAYLEATAYALILAGALGNLTDRFTHGCVVDFVHFHYAAFSFPVFNVADTSITFGAAAWIYVMYLDMKRERAERKEST